MVLSKRSLIHLDSFQRKI